MTENSNNETFTDLEAALIRLLRQMGFAEHRVASLFDVNGGRISEVNTNKRNPVERQKGKRLHKKGKAA